MTRKDYEIIAKALRVAHSNVEKLASPNGEAAEAAQLGIDHAATVLAEYLQKDNPRFNNATFLRAISTGE